MSPRAEEYLVEADRFLAAARGLIELGIPQNAGGEAYYAMLWAAKAALSEEGRHAKTHSGVWSLFTSLFVKVGRFDGDLFAAARRAEGLRLDSDYRFGGASAEEADATLTDAEAFVASVRQMLGVGQEG